MSDATRLGRCNGRSWQAIGDLPICLLIPDVGLRPFRPVARCTSGISKKLSSLFCDRGYSGIARIRGGIADGIRSFDHTLEDDICTQLHVSLAWHRPTATGFRVKAGAVDQLNNDQLEERKLERVISLTELFSRSVMSLKPLASALCFVAAFVRAVKRPEALPNIERKYKYQTFEMQRRRRPTCICE